MILQKNDVPAIPRGVRLHNDMVRGRWVLLAPERAINLDPIGHAILLEIDDTRSFGEIVENLAEKYQAPSEQIASDVAEFIEGLMARRILEIVE